MKSILSLSTRLSFALCWMLMCAPAVAWITGGGDRPVQDHGWPVGALEMANLPTRISWYEGPPFGGGDWHFQYLCEGTRQFNQALLCFSRILAPRLELIVVDGRRDELGGLIERADWEFQAWVPESYWRFNRLRSVKHTQRPLPPPRVTAYLGKGSPIEWEKVQVPENLTVIDKRVETSQYSDSQGRVVRITAYDMTTGKVIPGVDVVLEQVHPEGLDSKYSHKTDERGRALVRDIAAGIYQVTLRREGYATRSVRRYRNWERTLEIYDVLLAPVSSLSGTLTDLDGTPLSEVKVETTDTLGLDDLSYHAAPNHFVGQSAVTDKNGRFEIRDLPRGFTSLRVRKDGYCQMASDDVYEIPGKGSITVRMDRAGTIRGSVEGLLQQEPRQMIWVGLTPEGPPVGSLTRKTMCGPDGRFGFGTVRVGRYILTASTDRDMGGETIKRPIALKPGQVLEVDLKPK